MITSTEITNIAIFTFIATAVVTLLSRKILFTSEKTLETVKK